MQIKTKTISRLLQKTWIIKQTVVLLWKSWRKYESVSYLFSCNRLVKKAWWWCHIELRSKKNLPLLLMMKFWRMKNWFWVLIIHSRDCFVSKLTITGTFFNEISCFNLALESLKTSSYNTGLFIHSDISLLEYFYILKYLPFHHTYIKS